MPYCYWSNQCPYNKQCNRINYPASSFPDGYMLPLPEYYEDDFNLDADKKAETEYKSIDAHKASKNVTGVIESINQRALQEMDEIMRIGMDRRLLDYIIRTMVQYIDKNYDRYQGTIQRMVEMSLFDMKRDLGWVFDILRIYNVSSATENRLLDKVAKTAVQDLRPQSSQPQVHMPR